MSENLSDVRRGNGAGMSEWFLRWPFGHGHYASEALEEAVAENRRLFGWRKASNKEIAENIAASLFVRGFTVLDEDFLRMTRGEEPHFHSPGEAYAAWREKQR